MYDNLNSQLFLHHKTRIYVLTQIFLKLQNRSRTNVQTDYRWSSALNNESITFTGCDKIFKSNNFMFF